MLFGGFNFLLGWGESKEYLLGFYFYLYVSFVVVVYFLYSDVIFGVDERFCCGVGLGEGYYISNVLEVIVVFNFDLIGIR